MAYQGAQRQAAASRQQGEYQAAVNEQNARTAQQQAAYEANQFRQRNIRTAGAQKAALAANGVDIQSGSSVDVMTDSAIQGELDALASNYKGQIAYNRYMDAATYARMSGNNAAASYEAQGTGSLLTGLARGATAGAGLIKTAPPASYGGSFKPNAVDYNVSNPPMELA